MKKPTKTCDYGKSPPPVYLLHQSRLWVALIFMATLSGCGAGDGRLAVKGSVNVDGEPLASGEIVLLPAGDTKGPLAAAEIENGSFHISAEKGLLPGTYRVEITADRKTGNKIQADELSSELVDQYEQYLPAKYNDASELSAEITRGGLPLQFDLSISQ